MAITSKQGTELGYISMFYVVRETTLEVERAISDTLLFFGVGNTNCWHARNGICSVPSSGYSDGSL
jgi:hypothetical protein